MTKRQEFEGWWDTLGYKPHQFTSEGYQSLREDCHNAFLAGRKFGLKEAAETADKLIHVDCGDQWSITRTGAFKSFVDAIRDVEGGSNDL